MEGVAEPPAGQGLGWPAPSPSKTCPVCALSCWPFSPSDFPSSALKVSGRQGTLFFLQPSKFCCYSLDINGYSQAPESRGLPQQPSARPSAASTSKCIPRDFCPTGHMTLSRPELKHPASSTPALSKTCFSEKCSTRACWGDGVEEPGTPQGLSSGFPVTSVPGRPWVGTPSQAEWRDRGCQLRSCSLNLPQEARESRGREVTPHGCTSVSSV